LIDDLLIVAVNSTPSVRVVKVREIGDATIVGNDRREPGTR
jgi:hypothetical protein